MKKCNICKKEAGYYWKKQSGERLELCLEHYEAMEREVHHQEKSKRLLGNTLSVITGKELKDRIDCPNGKNCKYCKESNL